MNLFPFDEVNAVVKKVLSYMTEYQKPQDIIDIEDSVEDLLILAYMQGADDTAKQLGINQGGDAEKINKALKKEYDGKTYVDRLNEYYLEGDKESIKRVIETEAHRLYGAGQYDSAPADATKTWATMLDDRVRDTHDYLEGMTVPMGEYFFTYDGDSALYPGDFEKAENNCNCRCVLTFNKE